MWVYEGEEFTKEFVYKCVDLHLVKMNKYLFALVQVEVVCRVYEKLHLH